MKNGRENWSHSYQHIKHVKYNSRAHAQVALDGNQNLCHYQLSLSEIIYKTICINLLTLLLSF